MSEKRTLNDKLFILTLGLILIGFWSIAYYYLIKLIELF
jgi:hypothetical protein